jgi:hypothetical protein
MTLYRKSENDIYTVFVTPDPCHGNTEPEQCCIMATEEKKNLKLFSILVYSAWGKLNYILAAE